jgi:hypothetical protein
MLAEREIEPSPLPPAATPCAAAFGPGGTEYANKYYRARYYDPKIGRFISEDPIGFRGGANFYAYAQGNPVLFADPNGLYISIDQHMPAFVKEMIMRALARVRATQCGGGFITALERDRRRNVEIRIAPDPGRQDDRSHWNERTDILHLDLLDLTHPDRGYNTAEGPRAFTLEQILAHELGHATQGPLGRGGDPIAYEREATYEYENPVIVELGQLPRLDPMIPFRGWKK